MLERITDTPDDAVLRIGQGAVQIEEDIVV
jgi:hypothetical protein